MFSLSFGNMIRPEAGSYINYTHVPFEWEQEPDAIEYNLQVSTQSNFNSLIINSNVQHTLHIDIDNINWNETYHWRVRPVYQLEDGEYEYGEWIGNQSFNTTGTALENLINIDIIDEEYIQEGYVAIGGFAPELESAIIDKYGNEVWNDDGFQFMLNHINDHGNMYGMSTISYPLNTGMKGNTDMDVVWATLDSNNPVDTHEIKQLPNGNYMAFIRVDQQGPIPSDNYMTQYFQMLGYQADGVTTEFPWYGQMIVEWNEDHEVVWSWNPFDHFTMQDYDNYEGTWYNAYFNQEVDWMHSNAFHFDQEESVIYVSHRHLSRISKIAYPSGEIIWNMGLPAEYMTTGDEHICSDLLFSFQHNIQLMDNGDLMFFDNGNLSDMLLDDLNPTTRIRRIRVIDDSYCETVWQYDLPSNLFGAGMGSVQEQENGNYLIYTFGSGFGPECSVIEVSPSEENGLDEQGMVWKATGDPNTAWYRAYKVPSVHPDVFSVVANNYKSIGEGDGILVSSSNPSMTFTVYNKSGYSQDYYYLFTDNENGWFENSNGVITVMPNSSQEITFESSLVFGNQTEISLVVNPIYHSY